METGKIVSDMLLDILPKKIMESGKGRGYFGERILDHWFPELTEDERALVILLAKAVLDRAFQPEGGFCFHNASDSPWNGIRTVLWM